MGLRAKSLSKNTIPVFHSQSAQTDPEYEQRRCHQAIIDHSFFRLWGGLAAILVAVIIRVAGDRAGGRRGHQLGNSCSERILVSVGTVPGYEAAYIAVQAAAFAELGSTFPGRMFAAVGIQLHDSCGHCRGSGSGTDHFLRSV